MYILCQQTTYTITVQSPSKQTLLPLLPATAPLTQSKCDVDHLSVCLPDFPSLKSYDLSLLYMEPLIGREKETTAILKWLEFQDSPVQVVSIVGGPGVGKSALAVAVGHKLIQQGIAVCYVDMYNASERNMKQFQISKHLDELASQVRRPTLLILDNCDHYIHTQRKEFQNLALSQKYRFVKVLITSQVRIQVAFSGHGFEEYHLQKLDKDQAKNLLQQSVKGLTSFAAGYICDLVDSMPLAIVNVAAYLNLKSTCNSQCVIGKLEEAPIDFFTETEMSGKYSVTASIKLAYDYISLDPNFQVCGWELVTVPTLEIATENVCLDELKKHLIVENYRKKSTGGLLHAGVCISKRLHLDLNRCYHTVEVNSVQVYRLPRLIRLYFVRSFMMRRLTRKDITSRFSSLASRPEVISRLTPSIPSPSIPPVFMGTMQGIGTVQAVGAMPATGAAQDRTQVFDYIFHRMCAPLLKQRGELSSSTWNSNTTKLVEIFPVIISTYVNRDHIFLNIIVEYGAKAFYWGTPSTFFETDMMKKFAVSSLEVLDNVIKEQDMAASRNKYQTPENILASYVYFNHKSLGIQWPTRTRCPNSSEAVSKMVKRKHQVEVLHHMTRQNGLAWSAYRAFYIDLFSCCMAAPQLTPGCERLWEYWLKGIMAQAVATNYMFRHVSPCEGSPAVVVSNTFRGLWYYYNNGYFDAKNHLFQALHEQERQNKCQILRVATIMALYNMFEDMSERAKAKITDHLNDKLMDFGLPQHQTIYGRVIVPFYREVNKLIEAKRLEEQLNIKSSHNLHIRYECEYIYWVHNTSYETYVLAPMSLKYVDHRGINPLYFSLAKFVFNSVVITVMLKYIICPCVSKKLRIVQHQKFLKILFGGITCAVIQIIGFQYPDIYIFFEYILFGASVAFFFCSWVMVIKYNQFLVVGLRRCKHFVACTRLRCYFIILCCYAITVVIMLTVLIF